jgi:8-oxo-dGTP pyrophosphatase MutT (NUDIX family)
MKLYLLIISMGGGILPIAFKNGKIYFLFGRETIDIWKDSGLWSDFGGGKEKNETYKETAIREGWEETDGVLGNLKTIEYLIENNTIDTITYRGYKTFIVYINYDARLPQIFRKNFKKIQKENPELIAKKGMYEKDMIKWFEYDEIQKKKNLFRPWYKGVLKELLNKY